MLTEKLSTYTALQAQSKEIKQALSNLKAEIIDEVGFGDGTQHHIEGTTKVTTVGQWSRKANLDTAREIRSQLNKDEQTIFDSVFKKNLKVSESGFKSVRDSNPVLFTKLCDAITSKPAATDLKLSEVKPEE